MLKRCEAYLVLNALQKNLVWTEFQKLISVFKTPEAILSQPESALEEWTSKKIVHSILHWEEKFDLKNEIKLIEKLNLEILHLENSSYPKSLKQIPNPPLLLYCKGKLLAKDQQAIAMVGSRRATLYGTKITLQLAQQLAQKDWTLVSGLAWGIDTHAHKGALLGNGRTIAVIGQGLNTTIFPPDNEALAQQIVENGAILSEFPLNFAPVPRNFPQRNRIISGMSQGVVVVEAAKRSGAFITADFALEQGKPVCAVPGPIDSSVSEGPHLLIQQGAKLVLTAQDILEEISPNEETAPSPIPKGLSLAEESVWKEITKNGIYLDQLIDKTKLTAKETATLLFNLEIKNLVKQLPGQYYVKL